MGLTLVNPAALLGLLAVGVPVLIHLMRKREQVKVLFPATKLLADSATVLTRSRRLAELLLLAARIALVAALVAAFTRPRLRSAAVAPSGKITAAIAIVIDDSPSMGHVDEGAPGESRLDRARRAAGRVLDQLGPGSEAMIVSSSGAVVGPTGSIDQVAERVEGTEATELAGDVPAAAAVAAREIGRSGLSRREVVVFSDLEGTSWPGVKNVSAVARRGGEVRVIVFDVGLARDRAHENLSVSDLSSRRGRAYAGVPYEVVVTVRSSGGAGGRDRRRAIVLSGEGLPEMRRKIDVPLGASVQVPFDLTFDSPGPKGLTARLEPGDGLGFDDARHLAVDVTPPVNTALVVPAGPGAARSARYVAAALQPGGRRDERFFRVREITPRELAAGVADEAELFVVLPGAGLSAADWRRLRSAVATGAGALIFCGEWCEDEAMRTAAAPVFGRIAVSPSSPAAAPVEVIAPAELQRALADGRNGRISTARVMRLAAVTFAPGSPYRTVARLTGGADLAWHGRMGQGRIMVLGFEPVPEWTDLVRHPSWLPLLHESAAWLARPESAARSLTVGGPARFRIAPGAKGEARRWTFGPEGGEMIMSGRLPAGPGARAVFAGRVTRAGLYELLASGGVRALLSANADAGEGALERIEASDAAAGGEGGRLVHRSAEELVAELRMGRFGRELTGLMIVIALLVFAAETALVAYLAASERRGSDG